MTTPEATSTTSAATVAAAATAGPPRGSSRSGEETTARSPLALVSRLLHLPGAGVTISYIVLCVILASVTDTFFTVDNLTIVLRQSVMVGVMAIGMTLVIGMGEIDLSVGAILGICGLAAAIWIQGGVNIYLAVFGACLLGAAIGMCNGVLVTYLRLPSFVATLGSMSVLRGIIMVITGGVPVYGLRYPEFQFIGQGFIGPVPVPVVILLLLFVIFAFVLYRTPFGRYILSIGSNAQAARLAGIRLTAVRIATYAITGFLCAVAGVILASRSEAATADAGSGMELDVIAATIIGGTVMTGGKAVLYGTIVGAVLMTTIRNGLNLLGVSPLWHQVVIGAFILISVAGSMLTVKRGEGE
ncbi:MAG: ABC transporter permease [Propionibacteriaceae bacterium]|jgi:ribose transport system permease protein|nr:ABC transporter permease [Propionibacteriaceae bacterium]